MKLNNDKMKTDGVEIIKQELLKEKEKWLEYRPALSEKKVTQLWIGNKHCFVVGLGIDNRYNEFSGNKFFLNF